MKKILTLTLLMIFLTSCSFSSPSGYGQKITPPANVESPMFGEWIVKKTLTQKDKKVDNDVYSELLTKGFKITKDYFIIDNYYWNDLSLKTKLVSSNDYLNSVGAKLPQIISGLKNELEVFSITSKSKLLCELTLLTKNTGLLDIYGSIYEVSKKSSYNNVNISSLKPASTISFYQKSMTNSKTGVLIGLKTPDNDDNANNSFKYRTLWISKSNDQLNPILEIDTMIFPRKNGFWTLSEDIISKNNIRENIFVPKDLSQTKPAPVNKKPLITEQTLHGYSNGNILKEVTYICNDYISVKITGNAMKNGVNEPINKLHMYPISSLPYENSMSIEDIFRGSSVDFIRGEFFSALKTINGSNISFINADEQSQNIGITRRDSHWLFTGRIGYFINNKFRTLDYNLSVIPPSNIVFYDNLYAPLHEVKESIPYAKDAFSSPDNSMALIQTENYLYVYSIKETPFATMEIAKTPLAKIKLKDGESVIMSEWAGGEYVNSWNNFMKSYNPSKTLKK
ncbi:hypothetical protein [Clostridium cylindrosporum]|uniref:Lipoprotein n=1 Tax=Clostridium cylindrosporum DSM 605 TaxID=1121307 RepID=A0A0J8D4P3_CLOCY|nr:hypothetical protein [Clostridium cylindrosporum]KMT21135.1 hypothetical protein CLCY_1c03690 [Clostridium cylindrosporum DSM 605]